MRIRRVAHILQTSQQAAIKFSRFASHKVDRWSSRLVDSTVTYTLVSLLSLLTEVEKLLHSLALALAGTSMLRYGGTGSKLYKCRGGRSLHAFKLSLLSAGSGTRIFSTTFVRVSHRRRHGRFYTWLNLGRLSGSRSSRFIACRDGGLQGFSIASGIPAGNISSQHCDLTPILSRAA